MDFSKDQLGYAVKDLLAQDVYKPLSVQLGGWFWTTEAIWAAIQLMPGASLANLRMLCETALAVPGHMKPLLVDFVSDLVDIIAIVAADSGDIVEAAIDGGTEAAAMPVIVIGRAGYALKELMVGRNGQLSAEDIVNIGMGALMGGAMLVPVVGQAAYTAGIVGGAGYAAVSRGGDTARKAAAKAKASRTAGRLGYG